MKFHFGRVFFAVNRSCMSLSRLRCRRPKISTTSQAVRQLIMKNLWKIYNSSITIKFKLIKIYTNLDKLEIRTEKLRVDSISMVADLRCKNVEKNSIWIRYRMWEEIKWMASQLLLIVEQASSPHTRRPLLLPCLPFNHKNTEQNTKMMQQLKLDNIHETEPTCCRR